MKTTIKNTALLLFLAFLVSGFLTIRQADALLIGVEGGTSDLGGLPHIVSAPSSAGNDGTTSLGMQGFNERQYVTLAADLAVDGGFISSGTTINSHMLLLDAGVDRFPFRSNEHRNVTWTFDAPILGVMSDFYGTLEAASSSFLGAPGTAYPAPFIGRGFETDQSDSYVIDGNRLTVTMWVTEPGDWIRVVTQVPEPSAFLLLGSGLVALWYMRKKTRI